MRRRLLVGADIAMTFAVVVAIAVVASVLTSSREMEMLPSSYSSESSVLAPVLSNTLARESDIEHMRKHLLPGYRCPQHPEVISDQPGSCVICGESYVWFDGNEDLYLTKQATVERGAQRIKDVIMLGSGWVDRIAGPKEGGTVARGQLLMEVFSPELKQEDPGGTGILRLYSPVSGVVELIGVDEDKFIGSGATVMQILDTNSIWLSVALEDDELSRIGVGQRVETVGLGSGNGPWMGEVGEIQTRRDGTTYAWLRFEEEAGELLTQANVNVRIHARTISAAYTPGF